MSRILACLVIAVAVNPAAACINDVELPSYEREFRSQYRDPDPAPAPTPPSAEPSGRISTGLLLGTGVALLVAAAALTLTVPRARN